MARALLVVTLLLTLATLTTLEKAAENALRREYPLEDFLWTGSGDGAGEEERWLTTTVFRTTTRLIAPPASVSLLSCVQDASCHPSLSPSSPDSRGVTELEPSEQDWLPKVPTSIAITPVLASTVTPSDRPPDHTKEKEEEDEVPAQKFWIVTVVEGEQKSSTPRLELGLAKLYSTAFKRQQQRHLGILNATLTRGVMSRRKRSDDDVRVRVHEVDIGSRQLHLVYSVHVHGRPVLARAAVKDMGLVSDAEVVSELGGVAVLTKAEPYLKDAVASARGVSSWVVAAGAISALVLLALVLLLLLLATSRHKRHKRRRVNEGSTNLAFEPEPATPTSDTRMLSDSPSPPSPAQAAAAVSAAVSAALSPATSYLSMPSVRKFPRMSEHMPEPLSQVLQRGEGCLSVRNLDVYPDESVFTPHHTSAPHARHSSLDGEDPGVVGPMVYLHGAGQARRRLGQLLDDAFSLFGGSSSSGEDSPPPRPPSPRIVLDSRVHSAAQARVSEPDTPPPPRPKTCSDSRRAAMQQQPAPRGAWGENVRPLSAGPFHRPRLPSPRVLSARVLADAELPANDPAVPLISAIRDELSRVKGCTSCTSSALPGATNNPPNKQ